MHKLTQTSNQHTHSDIFLLKQHVSYIRKTKERELKRAQSLAAKKNEAGGLTAKKEVYLITPMLILGVGTLQWLIAWLQLGLGGFLAVLCCQNLPQVPQVQGRLIKMIRLKKINAIWKDGLMTMLPTEILMEGSLRPISTGPSVAMLFCCEALERFCRLNFAFI